MALAGSADAHSGPLWSIGAKHYCRWIAQPQNPASASGKRFPRRDSWRI